MAEPRLSPQSNMSDEHPTPDSPQFRYKEIGATSPSEQRDEGLGPNSILSNYSQSESSENSNNPTNKIQGYVLIILGVIVVGLVAWSIFRPAPKFAYKVINVQAQFNKTGPSTSTSGQENNSKLNSTNVNLSDEDLSILGKEGWELVDTFLEMETTHPNYGSTEYVTGLQPNIRPQRAVLLFKKRL